MCVNMYQFDSRETLHANMIELNNKNRQKEKGVTTPRYKTKRRPAFPTSLTTIPTSYDDYNDYYCRSTNARPWILVYYQ
jgi:hypothetical protein